MTAQASLLPAADVSHDPFAEAFTALLAAVFVLYLKTKSFHWHVGGPHFRDYHRSIDEQAT